MTFKKRTTVGTSAFYEWDPPAQNVVPAMLVRVPIDIVLPLEIHGEDELAQALAVTILFQDKDASNASDAVLLKDFLPASGRSVAWRRSGSFVLETNQKKPLQMTLLSPNEKGTRKRAILSGIQLDNSRIEIVDAEWRLRVAAQQIGVLTDFNPKGFKNEHDAIIAISPGVNCGIVQLYLGENLDFFLRETTTTCYPELGNVDGGPGLPLRWQGAAIHHAFEKGQVGSTFLCIDPLDEERKSGMRSHIKCGPGKIQTSYSTRLGHQLQLDPGNAGLPVYRLEYVMPGRLESSGQSPQDKAWAYKAFVPNPELSFAVSESDGTADHFDLLMGTSGHEFVRLSVNSLVSFPLTGSLLRPVPGGSKEIPSGKMGTIDIGDIHQVRTPWLMFAKPKATKDAGAAKYFAGPDVERLYAAEQSKDMSVQPLVPHDLEVGDPANLALPVFPWANAPAARFAKDGVTIDDVYLRNHRLKNLVKSGVKSKAKDVPLDQPPNSVSPQGLLAKTKVGQGINALLFGSGVAGEKEFELPIPSTPETEELQRRLLEARPFVVIRSDAHILWPTLNIASWQLESPWLILKFDDRQALDQVKEVKFAGMCLDMTPKDIAACFKNLRNLCESKDEEVKGIQVRRLKNPKWCGLLALGAKLSDVPNNALCIKQGLPENANGVAIPAAGFDQIPVPRDAKDWQKPRLGRAFCVIKYPETKVEHEGNAGADGETGTSFMYRVEDLLLVVENSKIQAFRCELSVGFNKFLKQETTPNDPTDAGRSIIRITGSYEKRKKGGESLDVYTFKAKSDDLEIEFGADSIFSSLKLTGATLSVTKADGEDPVSRFTMDGKFALNAGKLTDVIDKEASISFQGVGLDLKGLPKNKNLRMSFDCSASSFGMDWDKLKGFLGLFPLRPTGFHFAWGNAKPFNLGSLGFKRISGIDDLLDGALKFELDLGSLGKLSPKSAKLKLPVLLGWKGGKFALGIGFPQYKGDIDIGLQQVVRLKAKDAELRPYGTKGDVYINLAEVRIEILGKKWPDQDVHLDAVIVVKEGRVHWLCRYIEDDGKIRLLALGQRLRPPLVNWTSTADVIKDLEKRDPTEPALDITDKWISPNEGWFVGTHFLPASFLDLQMVFCDTDDIYGLRVAVLAGENKSLGYVDILYRRVADDLGVYSVDWELPPALKRIEAGAMTIKLPTIGLSVFTDGGFSVDLGFPRNRDWSRSGALEIVPYVGLGGFFFARTRADAVPVLAQDDSMKSELRHFRAFQIGFGAAFGLGKSIDQGMFKAGVYLMAYITLEGVSARRSYGNTSPLQVDLYSIRGECGVQLDVWGCVDFCVVRAEFSMRLYLATGFEMGRVLRRKEGDKYIVYELPIVIAARAGVLVKARLVIDLWIGSITLSFEFSKDLEVSFKLSDGHERSIDAPSQKSLPQGKPLASPKAPAKDVPAFVLDAAYVYFKKENGDALQRTLVVWISVEPCFNDSLDAVIQVNSWIRRSNGGIDAAFPELLTALTAWYLSAFGVAITEGQKQYISAARIGAATRHLDESSRDMNLSTAFSTDLEGFINRQFVRELKRLDQAESEHTDVVHFPAWPDLVGKINQKSLFVDDVVKWSRVVETRAMFDDVYRRHADQKSFTPKAPPGGEMNARRIFAADYARTLLRAVLGEMETQLVAQEKDKDGVPREDQSIDWDEFWTSMKS